MLPLVSAQPLSIISVEFDRGWDLDHDWRPCMTHSTAVELYRGWFRQWLHPVVWHGCNERAKSKAVCSQSSAYCSAFLVQFLPRYKWTHFSSNWPCSTRHRTAYRAFGKHERIVMNDFVHHITCSNGIKRRMPLPLPSADVRDGSHGYFLAVAHRPPSWSGEALNRARGSPGMRIARARSHDNVLRALTSENPSVYAWVVWSRGACAAQPSPSWKPRENNFRQSGQSEMAVAYLLRLLLVFINNFPACFGVSHKAWIFIAGLFPIRFEWESVVWSKCMRYISSPLLKNCGLVYVPLSTYYGVDFPEPHVSENTRSLYRTAWWGRTSSVDAILRSRRTVASQLRDRLTFLAHCANEKWAEMFVSFWRSFFLSLLFEVRLTFLRPSPFCMESWCIVPGQNTLYKQWPWA